MPKPSKDEKKEGRDNVELLERRGFSTGTK